MFASLNSCRGFNKSRRDDIESTFYLLAYLLNDKKLPWSYDKEQLRKQNFSDAVKNRLNIAHTRELLLRYVPINLKQAFKNAMVLKFDEKPDYGSFITSLTDNFEVPKPIGPPSVQQPDI